MINVALGEDLGEEAVNQIGKLSQMFGDESRTLKDNMLAIGSAVNQVAQSTSASEPYLVQFTANPIWCSSRPAWVAWASRPRCP